MSRTNHLMHSRRGNVKRMAVPVDMTAIAVPAFALVTVSVNVQPLLSGRGTSVLERTCYIN